MLTITGVETIVVCAILAVVGVVGRSVVVVKVAVVVTSGIVGDSVVTCSCEVVLIVEAVL
jgi:hypothetical protein